MQLGNFAWHHGPDWLVCFEPERTGLLCGASLGCACGTSHRDNGTGVFRIGTECGAGNRPAGSDNGILCIWKRTAAGPLSAVF